MSTNGPADEGLDNLEPPSDDLLAGELVLGVLDADQRRAAYLRTESDPAFAERVAAWERRLAPLAASIEPAEVPTHVWPQLRMRLGWTSSATRGATWQSVGLWRTVAGLAAAAAVAAIIVGRIATHAPTQPENRPEPVITLARDNGAPGWLASIDAEHGTLLLVPVPAPRDSQGRVPELWLIPPGAAPRPLGLLSTDRSAAVSVPAPLRPALRSGAVLAISLEPPGGAPQGSPTGPIIAKGTVRL